MPRRIAVQNLVDLRPAQEEVAIVLPREADATVELEALTADRGIRLGNEGTCDVYRLGGVIEAVADGQRGVTGRGSHRLELDVEVGEAMFDRLEAADGTPELDAV